MTFNVVLACHLHGLKSLSGSLQWPALRVQLDQVTPCCWSQLGLLQSVSCTVCLSVCVWWVILGLLLQRWRCAPPHRIALLSLKLKRGSCDQSFIFEITKKTSTRLHVKGVSKTNSTQNSRTFFSLELNVWKWKRVLYHTSKILWIFHN